MRCAAQYTRAIAGQQETSHTGERGQMIRAIRSSCSLLMALALASCSETPEEPKPPATGRVDIRVSTNAAAIDADADGYSVTVNTEPSKSIKVIDALTIVYLPVGSLRLKLEGIAPNCSIIGPAEISLEVIPAGTATAAFSVSCVANIGTVRVTTVSSGQDASRNSYTLVVPGLAAVPIGANDTLTFGNVRVGTTSQAALIGVPLNCAVVSPS